MLYVLYKYTYHKMIVKFVNKKRLLLKENTILVFLLQNVIVFTANRTPMCVCVFNTFFHVSLSTGQNLCL